MHIEHVAMYVNDLETVKDFFVKYFGAQPTPFYQNPKSGFKSYFLSFDDGARLELMNRPSMEDAPKALFRTGLSHIAFNLGSTEKVDEMTARMHEDGLRVLHLPRTTGDGYYESCVIDLEGNLIELMV
ncbi:MAG: VOC family protein [Oscillospiraceae bacterium]|nr:VOC family protein [Oscillospiraceae bacterium]